MNASLSASRGIVVDKPVAHALLRLAITEGLVDGNPKVGDGFVAKILSEKFEERELANALEHIILGGRILVPFWLPSEWRGEMFEKGLIVPMDSATLEDGVKVTSLSNGLILGMLRSRGFHWNENDLLDIYKKFSVQYSTWEALASGKSFDGLEVQMFMAKIFGSSPPDFTFEQIESWRALNETYKALRPVVGCVEDYEKILTASLDSGAICGLSVSDEALSLTPTGVGPDQTSAELSLLRLTCSEFRRMPIARTLRGTLELAATDGAAELRSAIQSWTSAAQFGQSDPLEIALKDINRARKDLSVASSINQVGSYTTIVGTIATALSLSAAIPLASGVSILATFAGAVVLAGEKYLKFKNRWALFSQS